MTACERITSNRGAVFENQALRESRGRFFNGDEGLIMSQKAKNRPKQRVNGHGKVKVEVYGEEVIEKIVKGNNAGSARIYLPPDWKGCLVKIIKVS